MKQVIRDPPFPFPDWGGQPEPIGIKSPFSSHKFASGGQEINEHLKKELQARLDKAGVKVVAARTQIIEGAVGMVEMALHELGDKDLANFNDDRKATMISKLLVLLCSEHAAQPVVSTGTTFQQECHERAESIPTTHQS